MASALIYKVYDKEKECRAVVRYLEDAAVLVSVLGDGATIMCGGWVLWHEGKEEIPAHESYDQVRAVALGRLRREQQEAYMRAYRRSMTNPYGV